MTDTTHPPTIRDSRGRTSTLVATSNDGAALYLNESFKTPARRVSRGRGNVGHTFRATVKTYIRRDAEGRVRPWTRDVRSGYRQTAHKRPQPPTEGRWSWVKEDDAS